MALPTMTITFQEAAKTAFIRSQRGVVGLVLRETSIPSTNPAIMTSTKDIPDGITEDNELQIRKAFLGYLTNTSKVIAYFIPAIGTTTYTYTAVTPDTGDDPSTEGWYELSGTTYSLSTDTVAKTGVTYYEQTITYTAVTTTGSENPSEEGWYVLSDDTYTLTTDTEVVSGTTYYEQTVTYTAVEDVEYADDPATEGWYVLEDDEYTASTDTYPVSGTTYYSRTSTTVEEADIDQYEDALNYFVQYRVNYAAFPTIETEGIASDVATWIKDLHSVETETSPMIAVLPNTAADSEYIINYTIDSVTDDDGNTYTAEGYCGRIAGLIASTPMTRSCTYAPLTEVTDCTYYSKSDLDDKIDAGEFVIFYDGEKVKVGRGVNSLTTTSDSKSSIWKKIRIVDIICMIRADIAKAGEDSYIGKYTNSYDNKLLLVNVIKDYFKTIASQGALGDGSTCDVDTDANRDYLKYTKGVDVTDMTDDEIRRANTDDQVFLEATISVLDAMEDITLDITI